MLRTDLLMGRYEHARVVVEGRFGRLVRATAPGGEASILFLPADDAALAAERDALTELAGPGVPAAHAVHDPVADRAVLRLELPDDAVALRSIPALPPATLRAGLVRLLTVLSRAHRRGRVHGAITTDTVLASPDGEFWLGGWAGSRRLDAGEPLNYVSPVAADVRDLGAAFVDALLRGSGSTAGVQRVPTVEDLGGRGADRDFRRVLSRLLAPDPRDGYGTAAEVLVDLGHPHTLDPWQAVPFVERGDALERVLRVFERSDDQLAAVEIVGPAGSGRSRLLGWIAGALRARGALVLPAEARGGAWGGLASLARQLTQLVGRESAPWRDHEETLTELVADGGEPTDGSVLPVATALAALVAKAFRDGRGALVLDDADAMTPNAAETWRSMRRQAGALLGSRVLFVSSRTEMPAILDDVRPEIITIGDWSLAEVQHFLEGVFPSADLAADAAPVFRDLAGARPAEIVGLLRDLERGGSITRSGERWQLDVPLHALPEWTPEDSEEVRRSLRAAGRDAATLVEVLSVARTPLGREACERLSELPGPRLWSAAESAEAAGLLRQEGTDWRVRSERIRARVLAAMSRSRRRSLHREILAHLRATTPDDLAAQAWHARASAHPDAADLTRKAVDRLVAGGYFDTAVSELVDAEERLGDPDWGRAAWPERIELLRYAGRLGEALELADRLLAHPETTDAERADALVRRIHVLYESRDWDAVVEQELPDESATPEQLAELRYMRAAALADLCEFARAEREKRLAVAELSGETKDPRVRRAALEYEYKSAWGRGDHVATQRALLLRMRISAATGTRAEVPFDVCRRVFCYRYTGDPEVADRVNRRASQILDAIPEGARHARAGLVLASAITLAKLIGETPVEMHIRFATLYEQTGARVLVSTGRQRRTFTRVVMGEHGSFDHSVLRDAASRIPHAARAELLAWSYGLAHPLELLGYQPALEMFADRMAGFDSRLERVSLVLRSAVRSRLLWSDPLRLADVSSASRSGDPWTVAGSLASACVDGDAPPGVELQLQPSSLAALVAAFEIRTVGHSDAAGTAMVHARELGRMCDRVEVVEIGDVALGLALAIWCTEELDEFSGRWIARVLSAYDGLWFPQLRWQAALVDCKFHWRAGRLRAACASAVRAVDHARSLRDDRFGEWGERERAFALRTIRDRAPPDALVGLGLDGSPSGSDLPAAGRSAPPDLAPRRASTAAAKTVASVVLAARAGDLVAHLTTVVGVPVDASLAPGSHSLGRLTVVFLPELLAPEELRSALAGVHAARQARCDVIVCSVLTDDELDRAPPGVRLLVEAAGGSRLRLDGGALTPAERVERFADAVCAERSGLELSAAARAAVARYEWPGGAAEIRAVAEGVAARAAREVTPALLAVCGVPVSSLPGPSAAPVVSAILRLVDDGRAWSVGEMARATGASRRTLQRRLAGLADDGVLTRIGKGRAARYTAASAQG